MYYKINKKLHMEKERTFTKVKNRACEDGCAQRLLQKMEPVAQVLLTSSGIKLSSMRSRSTRLPLSLMSFSTTRSSHAVQVKVSG